MPSTHDYGSKAAKQFRDQLREAREYTLKDAEAFDGIIHVIIAAILIGFAAFAVALKLQAFDQLTATVVNVQTDFTFAIFH
jgi:hypothetical protein